MMRKYAMLGKWHVHAPQYADEINRLEGCCVARVWDPDAEVARAWAEELGRGCVASTVEEILNDPEIEGVVVGNATNEHDEYMVRVCESGKALFTEKVLTLSVEGAMKVREAVRKHRTRFGISFPHLSEPPVRFVLDTAKAGKLGKINYARFRKAHNGATANWLPPHFYDPVACGGGAMIDLGAHPMYLLCELYGKLPVRVQSSFTQMLHKGVEDNAVSLLTFDDGAIGVSETGFVSFGYPLIFEVGGMEGTIIMQGGEVKYCCPETGNEWVAAELPQPQPSPLEQWAMAKNQEELPASFGIDAAVRLTQVMALAYER